MNYKKSSDVTYVTENNLAIIEKIIHNDEPNDGKWLLINNNSGIIGGDEYLNRKKETFENEEKTEFFFNLIDNPPPPNERLAKAFDRYHERKVIAEDGTVSFIIV